MMKKTTPIYLDYAASTPVDDAVFRAMKPYFSEHFGNPGALHSFGQKALAGIDLARERVAKAIGAQFNEIIFTSSATEANNFVLRGAVKGAAQILINNPRIIISSIEHESILDTCRNLERDGVEIIRLPVNQSGVVNLEKLKDFLNERTILVSVMHVNNVLGTIQPIKEIAKIISEFKKNRISTTTPDHHSLSTTHYPLLHTDAVQAFQFLDCQVLDLGVDLMTLSSHKIYGPKGVGALYLKSSTTTNYPLVPIITGGGQEFGFRSGTENVPAIVGFGKAAELAVAERKESVTKVADLRKYFWQGIKKIQPKAEINGVVINDKKSVLRVSPNILNIYFPGQDSHELVIKLDLMGVAASAGAACSVRSTKSSYVINELGFKDNRSMSSIRFSLGKMTTKKDIDKAVAILKIIFKH